MFVCRLLLQIILQIKSDHESVKFDHQSVSLTKYKEQKEEQKMQVRLKIVEINMPPPAEANTEVHEKRS